MSEIVVGIDLGTTNSEVSVIENGQPVVIADAGGNQMLPSFIGVDNDGAMLVGEAARNQYAAFPERTIKSIKRLMGSDETVEMAGEQYKPQELSAMILKRLKTIAEAHIGQVVSKAVITVPAYFNDAQRQATREAGEIAGLEVVRIINEPTAAALAYESGSDEGKRILVYDLGGGTFDVSVAELQGGVVEVIASHGNNQLGGDDFDQKIVDFLCDELVRQHEIDIGQLPDQRQLRARLLRAAIEAKLALSDQPFVMIEEEYLTSRDGVPINLTVELARSDYEAMIMPFIDETLDAVHIALKDAGMVAADIEEILLVGGSTRTPLVAQMLASEVGLEPRSEVDPDLCVADGAGIQAGMLAGETVSAVLVDITPYTFGTSVLGMVEGETSDTIYAPIIKRGTPLPITKSEVFFTCHENQEAVDVSIYQGEDPDIRNNVMVGEFIVEGLTEESDRSPIVVKLALDVNGILNVTAVEKRTGMSKSITIENAVGRMEESELASARERVEELFGDDQSASDELASVESIEARALIAKAESLKEQASEEDREEMTDLIGMLKDALNSNDLAALKVPADELSELIYYLDR